MATIHSRGRGQADRTEHCAAKRKLKSKCAVGTVFAAASYGRAHGDPLSDGSVGCVGRFFFLSFTLLPNEINALGVLVNSGHRFFSPSYYMYLFGFIR